VNLGNFFSELKRRHVYRAGVLYCMSSWLLIQIATQVFPFFNIPNWVVRFIIILLVLGLPIAIILAWAFEVTPQGIVKTAELPAGGGNWPLIHRIYSGVIAVLAMAIAFLLYLRFSAATNQITQAAPGKSIAVLPFDNYSAAKENAYFADGIQDDLLTNLSKIQDLTVISRTSVMKYRDVGARDIRQIGKELGAATILEGSVRRDKDRVVVNVQLIDAALDRHIWAYRYDRTVQDSLGLEGDLATEIADALRAQLTPDEKVRVATRPTSNFKAYDLYLQALHYELKPDTFLQDYRTAEQLYIQAITVDPQFALAHARLGATYARIYHFYEPVESLKKQAEDEVNRALQLQPSMGEAYHARGLCYYWFDRDYARALAEFEKARALLPNDSSIPWDIAAIKRRQGHWDESVADYRRILRLDPQNANVVRDLLYTYCGVRDWNNAQAAAARLMTLSPDSINARIQVGYVAFWRDGTTTELRRQAAQVPPGQDPDGIVTACRIDASLIDRDPGEAAKILESSPRDVLSYFNGTDTPRSFFAGQIAFLQNKPDQARTAFAQAKDILAASAREAPDAPERHAFLGLVCAFLGEKDEAIREGKRAVELRPESQDALDGSVFRAVLAMIYARTGETDRAIALLAHLVSEPGPVDSANYSITVNDLKYRWEWDPLRKDARFQQLLSQP
jgi:TolB-like protein/Flp pilus assembly protein TadD